jgi:hypothetical protein
MTIIPIALFLIPFFWFDKNTMILGGETYTFVNSNNTFFNNSFTWNSTFGFGVPNLYIVPLFYHFFSFLLSIFFNTNILQKITFGLILSLSFISVKYLLIYLFKKEDSLAIAISSLFYIFNPFFAMMFNWIPIYGMIFIFCPVFLRLVMESIDSGLSKYKQVLLLMLLIIFSSLAMNLGLFLLSFIICGFYIGQNIINFKKFYKRLLIILLLVFIANIFWVLPYSKLYKSALQQGKVYSTNFQAESLFKKPLLDAITLQEYYWFDKVGPDNTLFYKYSEWYKTPSKILMLILIFMCALIIYISLKKKRYYMDPKYFTFTIFTFIVGIFLSKGTAEPLGIIYNILLLKIPLFTVYRSSDIKFPYLVVLSLTIIICLALYSIKNKIRKKILLLLCLAIILFQGSPLIFGDIFGQNVKISIPVDWSNLALISNKIDERILMLPKNFSPFDNYKWGYEGAWLLNNIISNSSISFTMGYGPSIQEKNFSNINEVYHALEKKNLEKFLNLLHKYNVNSILVRDDFDLNKNSNSTTSFGTDIDFYKKNNLNDLLSKSMHLIYKSGELTIYEVPDKYKSPKLISDNLQFTQINPTKYQLTIKNSKKDQELSFLESFDKNWVLFKSEDNLTPCIVKRVYNIDQKRITECKERKSLFNIKDLGYLFQKQIADDTHSTVFNYANKWKLNSEPNIQDKKDIQLTLYYLPQAYFTLGLLTTALGSIAFITFLFFYGYKDIKK